MSLAMVISRILSYLCVLKELSGYADTRFERLGKVSIVPIDISKGNT